MQVPVYLFTGFLDSGKTSFIQETLEDPRFNDGERTLVILCEEGEAELDFSGVSEIGQAFAHELFVVWQGNHPDISLVVTNACPEVDFMIKRAINTKY